MPGAVVTVNADRVGQTDAWAGQPLGRANTDRPEGSSPERTGRTKPRVASGGPSPGTVRTTDPDPNGGYDTTGAVETALDALPTVAAVLFFSLSVDTFPRDLTRVTVFGTVLIVAAIRN